MITVDETRATALHLDELEANPDNPRSDLGDLTELAASIVAQGVLQPLLVIEIGGDPCGCDGGTHMVVDGHRRLAALQQLQRELMWSDVVPVRVVDMDRTQRLLAALATGTHGRPLSPIDEAKAFQHLVDLDLTQRQIAERVGCNQSHVSKRLALLDLDDDTKTAVTEGKVKVSDALRTARGQEPAAPKVTVNPQQFYAMRDKLAQAREHLGELANVTAERDRFREHSVLLNKISWRIAEALGQVGPEDDSHCGDVEANLEVLIECASSIDMRLTAAGEPEPESSDALFAPAATETVDPDPTQADWEDTHPERLTTPPWPPYERTGEDRLLVHIGQSPNTVTMRHVIAWERTHQARPAVLQAATDRLFELG